MARKSRKPALALPTVARKRHSYETRSGCGTRAAKIVFKAVNEGPKFIEDDNGDMVRQWKPEELGAYTNDDMRKALSFVRVIEAHEILSYCPPTAIKFMQTKGWIAKDAKAPFFWVTRKGAAELNLPQRDREGRKLLFLDRGLN